MGSSVTCPLHTALCAHHPESGHLSPFARFYLLPPPFPAFLMWVTFRSRGANVRSRCLYSLNCLVQGGQEQEWQPPRAQLLVEPSWRAVRVVAGSPGQGVLDLVHRERREPGEGRLPCSEVRVTAPVHTAFGLARSSPSVAVPFQLQRMRVLTKTTPESLPRCVRDHRLNYALLWIFLQILIFQLGWFCLWCHSKCSLLFGSNGFWVFQSLA